MKLRNMVALCGFLITATLSFQASSLSTGTYFLANHPDGNANPPLYGLRLDGLLGPGTGIYTFDFEDPASDMKLDWNGARIHIFGTAFGGEDNGNDSAPGYTAGSTAVWTIDFIYDMGVTTVSNGGIDDVVVGKTGHHNNTGTLSSGLGSFDLRSHGENNGLGDAFNLGDEAGAGHRGFAGISGWGWLDYRPVPVAGGGSTWTGSDDGCCSDWLFTMSPVPVPAAVWLFGSGLIGLIAVARRRAE